MKKKIFVLILTALLVCSFFTVAVYANDEKTEASGKNSVDPKEWPMLAALELTDEELLAAFKEYDEAVNAEPIDLEYDDVVAYEEQIDKDIAEKYGIDVETAPYIYYYGITEYDKLVKATGGNADGNYDLTYGEFLEANGTGSTIVIKAKIEPSLTNKLTIEQNYYNIVDLIQNQGLDKYDEIQYWAVADMTDGSESKVISFTVPKDVIDYLAENDFPANMLGDYLQDLWILPSLTK